MGNQLMKDIFSNRETAHVSKSNFWKSIKSKVNTIRKKNVQYDDFIIKYNQTNQNNENKIDINSLDQRRIVFVSLIGFYQTWDKCPSLILYTCLLLMPLKRKWIYKPDKYINELKSCFISQLSIFSDTVKMNSFIKLLKWKDSQCLILWMLDDEEKISNSSADSLVAPFWYSLSQKLTNLWDPISGNYYRPLNFSQDHWQNKYYFHTKYHVKREDILRELRFLSMKFKPMQEIISESNPNSLNPIMFYGETNDISQSHKKMSEVYDEFEVEEVENWWVSQDYNPNVVNDIQD